MPAEYFTTPFQYFSHFQVNSGHIKQLETGVSMTNSIQPFVHDPLSNISSRFSSNGYHYKIWKKCFLGTNCIVLCLAC